MIVLFVIWLVNMINMAADSVTNLIVIFILKLAQFSYFFNCLHGKKLIYSYFLLSIFPVTFQESVGHRSFDSKVAFFH